MEFDTADFAVNMANNGDNATVGFAMNALDE